MDLNLKKSVMASVAPMDDITFALHALAVIEVHSNQNDEGKKMTIRQIARCDSYLANKENNLLFNMMCSFGQHAVPVFEKYLASYGKAIEYGAIVAEIGVRMNAQLQ